MEEQPRQVITRQGTQELVLLNEDRMWPELHQVESRASPAATWFLNNGASNHMTGDKRKFQELDENVTGRVRFSDGRSVEIKGKSSILFACRNGEQWLLEKVYYIPSLLSNMVSLGQLRENGHKVIIDGDELEVFAKDPTWLIMKVRRSQNHLYKIDLKLAHPICLLASLDDPVWLWYARLGHANFLALKMLADKEMVCRHPGMEFPNAWSI